MAIVKASFTRSSESIKKILHYIVHRPGREGEELNRELFGHTEESIRKEDAYRRFDAGGGMTFFHLKINFHPKREDTRKDLNLRDITRRSIVALEKRLDRQIRFLTVEHNDHTPLRHIHAIILVKLRRGERIGIEEWKACREEATDQARLQRRALDAVLRVQQDRQRESRFHKSSVTLFIGMPGGRKTFKRARFQRLFTIPDPCPQCDGRIKQSLKTLRSGAKWCRLHGVIREERQRITREQGLGL
jgi:hypothetical protein